MKKILSVIVLLVIIMSAAAVPSFASGSKTEADNEKISLITELGIVDYPSDDSVFDEAVTRAEFALYAGRLIGIDENTKTADRYYKDLPADHWAAGAINAMTQRGVLKGDDGLFRPDEHITMAEAVTILLSALGFDEFVNMRGGWPLGYTALAYEYNLTDGVKNADALTLLDVYRLMYNTMFAPVPEKNLESPSKPVIKINEDETIMGVYFDVYRVTGRIKSALGMSADTETPCIKGKIRIDKETYDNECDFAVDYLGCKVNAYYRKSDDERSVFLICPKSGDDILEIDIADFEKYDEETHTIKYDSGSKTKLVQIAVNATVLKNGESCSSDVRGAFADLEQGSIRLIKSENSNIYDTVIIKNYEDIVVLANDTAKKQIFDRIKSGTVLEVEDIENLRIFDSEKNPMAYEDIVGENILSVCASEDFCEIIVSAKTGAGVVSNLSTSGDDPSVTIDGSTYPMSKKFIKENPFTIRAGYTVTYYINAFGTCVYAQSSGMDNSLAGYIINCYGTESDTVILKMLTQTGSVEKIECAQKVTVNRQGCRGAEAIENKLKENRGKAAKQLILYRLNEDGKIKIIETAAPYGAKSEQDALWQDSELKTAVYYPTNLMMGDSIKMTDSTICFVAPPETTDMRDYTVMSPSSFVSEKTYDVTAYKTDDSTNTADILVISTDASAGTWFHQILLVDKIYDEYNPDTDEVEEYADLWLNGTKTKYALARNYKLSDNGIKSGDILRVDTNRKGEITAAYRAYDYENKIPSGLNSGFNWEIYITYGYITSIKDNVAKFEYDDPSKKRTGITTLTGVPIMVYDGSMRVKAEVGNISDVMDAMNNHDLVFVGQKYGATTCIIITR